jgi:hypothetical protein
MVSREEPRRPASSAWVKTTVMSVPRGSGTYALRDHVDVLVGADEPAPRLHEAALDDPRDDVRPVARFTAVVR